MNKPSMQSPAYYIPVLAALLAAYPALAEAAVAGRFQFVFGDVHVIGTDGHERLARKGDEIREGETLVSPKGASAQLRMVDEGIIAVRPDTQMKIDTFHYDGKEDGTERSLLSLFRGGFRAITGAIGHLNKQNYQIKTPSATIGIRGTDHEPMHIPAPGPGEVALGKPGTYEKVNVGQAVMQTAEGTLALGANQIGYVSAPNAQPTALQQVPSFYRPPPPAPGAKQPAESNTAQQTAETRAGTPPPSPAAPSTGPAAAGETLLPPPPPPPVQAVTSDNISFTQPVGTATPAPLGFAGFGADLYANTCTGTGPCGGAGGLLLDGAPGKAIYIGPNQSLVSVTDNSPGNAFQFTAGTATPVGVGLTTIDGTTVSWGRYENAGTVIDQGVTTTPTVFHYLGASSFIPPDATFGTVGAPITGTYTTLIGQSVSDNLGGAGSIGSVNIAANFTTHTITAYELHFGVPGKDISTTGGGSFADFYGKNGIPLSATVNGSSSVGKAYGAFVGTYNPNAAPAGVVSSFNVITSSSGTSAGGVLVAK